MNGLALNLLFILATFAQLSWAEFEIEGPGLGNEVTVSGDFPEGIKIITVLIVREDDRSQLETKEIALTPNTAKWKATLKLHNGPGQYLLGVFGQESKKSPDKNLATFEVTNLIDVPKKTNDSRILVSGRPRKAGTWLLLQIMKKDSFDGRTQTQYLVEMNGKNWSQEIYMHEGSGEYELLFFELDSISQPANGELSFAEFKIENTDKVSNPYLLPSYYVESNHPEIVAQAQKITNPKMSDFQKLQAVHDWVTKNISYDLDLLPKVESEEVSVRKEITALNTLREKKSVCAGYAHLTAALLRAVKVPSRMVHGESDDDEPGHVWNEVRVDGEWLGTDSTWNAGFVQEGKFHSEPHEKYFSLAPFQYMKNWQRISTPAD